MKATIARLALIALLILLATARAYGDATTENAGIAWDFGGVEYRGAPGVFMCAASGHMDGQTWVQDWTNPIAPIFPDLVVDC